MSKQIAPGIHPFWFWNTPLNPEIIQQQIAEMAAAGVRGVFIHPRQGMEVPYLSPHYFELIKSAIDACVQHSMQPHLYDEFPYPAGIAGGLVTMGRPEFQATALQHVHAKVTGPQIKQQFQEGAVLDCRLVPLQQGGPQWDQAIDVTNAIGVTYTNQTHFNGGLSAYTEQRYFAHDPVPCLEIHVEAGEYILSAAIQVHVQWHKYWNHYVDVCNPAAMKTFMAYTQERYQEALGKSYMQHVVGWFVDEIHPSWSRCIPEQYQEHFGYDMKSAYLALQNTAHPDHHREQERLQELQYNLFCDSFEKPVSDWCHDNDVLYVVEKPQLRIEQLSYADVPGCDAAHVRAGQRHDLLRAGLRYNARATGSAAQIYEKHAALCEGFHSLGWSATLEDVRYLSDHLVLHGIDRITPHAFFASSHGLRKHDAPPSFFKDQSYWPLFKEIPERLERIHALTGPLRHAVDALIIDPGYNRGDQDGLAYEDFLHEITASGCEYLIVDQNYIIEQDVTKGVLTVNQQSVRNIITYNKHINEALSEVLQHFVTCGGQVHHACIPEVDNICVTAAEQEQAEFIHQARFQTEHGFVLMAINCADTEVIVEVPQGYTAQSLDKQSGHPLQALPGNQWIIDPLTCLMFIPSDVHAPKQLVCEKTELTLEGEWRIQRDRSNLLRLADWSLIINQGNKACARGSVQPSIIGSHIAELQAPLHREQRQRFGQSAQVLPAHCSALYQHQFTLSDQIEDLALIWEQDAFKGRTWVLRINGQTCSPDNVYQLDRFGDGTTGIDIASYLQSGENIIELSIECEQDDDGLLAPLYLSGEFSVAENNDTIGKWESDVLHAIRSDINQLDAWGCAYYDGVLEYEGTIDLGDLSEVDEIEVDCRCLIGESFEVQIHESEWVPVLWSPRRIRLPSTVVQAGVNACRIRRYASLGRRYDGESFDYKNHRRVPRNLEVDAK